MRIRIAVPDPLVSPEVLNAALETTTRANQAMLESGQATPISHLIRTGQVKWKPEPFKDGEHFDLGHVVQKRKWGDCDDLAPAYAAELRATGEDPDARAVVVPSGPNLWHALVQKSDGELKDPSVSAGMRKVRGLHGTSIMGMMGGAILGLKPYNGGWASRCDLPLTDVPMALSGVAVANSPLVALTDAIEGACIVGGASDMVDPTDIARAVAIQNACAGDDYGEALHALDGELDPAEVGSIFSSIAHAFKKVIPAAASFIPIPGAGLAAQELTHLIPGTHEHARHAHAAAQQNATEHPPSGGVNVTRTPNGAIVVRF